MLERGMNNGKWVCPDIDVPTQIREMPETAKFLFLVLIVRIVRARSAKYHLLTPNNSQTQVLTHFAALATKYHVATTV